MGKHKRSGKFRNKGQSAESGAAERPATSATGSATGGEEATNSRAWNLRVIVKEGFLDKAKAAGKHDCLHAPVPLHTTDHPWTHSRSDHRQEIPIYRITDKTASLKGDKRRLMETRVD